MDLQDLFYLVATIFMVVIIGVIAAVALAIYFIKRKLLMLALLTRKPAKTAAEIGAGLIEGAVLRIEHWLKVRNNRVIP